MRKLLESVNPLFEGTWSLPDGEDEYKSLVKWFSKPQILPPKELEDEDYDAWEKQEEAVTGPLYGFFGDDGLFDEIAGYTKDLRPLVREYVLDTFPGADIEDINDAMESGWIKLEEPEWYYKSMEFVARWKPTNEGFEEAWSGEPEDDYEDGVKECPACGGEGCPKCNDNGVLIEPGGARAAEMSKFSDLADELEDVYDQIHELVQQASAIVKDADSERLSYVLDRGVLAHIETALSNDHHYLGGNSHTLRDVIEALRSGEV